MTPDLMDAGAQRVQARMEKLARATASGGREAGYSRVAQAAGEVDLTHGRILYLEDVSVSFDGFKAINKLSLDIAPGELRCIIGPNGAGKTTMMDIITGKTRPDEGTVFFGSTIDLLRYKEAEIAQLGIGRKFQKPTVFEQLTVFENLELALAGERGEALGVDALVVVAAVVIAAILTPVVANDLLDSNKRSLRRKFKCKHDKIIYNIKSYLNTYICIGIAVVENGPPEKHSPQAILLADMIGACAERLLAANNRVEIDISSATSLHGNLLGIHDVAEVLPASGSLKEVKMQVTSNKINSSRSRHTAGHTLKATLLREERDQMGMVNRVVPHAELETVGLEWGRLINGKSPTAQRMLKYSFNLIDDGLVKRRG